MSYEEIASILKENKYPFTDAQCASRMKTLVRQYKTVKDNNTSGCKMKTFMYEKELDSLYNASPNIRPQFVLSSIMDEDNDEDEVADAKCEKRKAAENIEEKGNYTSSPKVRKTQFSEVMEYMKVAADERERKREEREQRAEKRHEDKMNLFKEPSILSKISKKLMCLSLIL
ncbi:hypothetical protein DPMN_040404 [Dreissena polymorpha]|uniref:Myb/SANT-like DNA-binding domain-containing protein n=1 Tax=Dreissena polymorpha TaxID=45954 RepID=A0A9D4CVZ0_DREPO|nr:hypothetical protein DPMN_040404 [Dreissena polymorpha]